MDSEVSVEDLELALEDLEDDLVALVQALLIDQVLLDKETKDSEDAQDLEQVHQMQMPKLYLLEDKY